jgi:DNA-binding CsgD family transcriptional regulator
VNPGAGALWVEHLGPPQAIGVILSMAEKTVKQHLGSIFQKLSVEGRAVASLRALEVLANPAPAAAPAKPLA